MSSLVPAVDRAIRVLYLFKDGGQKEYGVSEISRQLGLNKSTVHNILNTLVVHQFLEQNEASRRYHLGPALVELGSLVRSRLDVRDLARPYLRRLMKQTNATILLGTFNGHSITIVDQEEPVTDVRVTASIGMSLPFCAGSFGQAFLAFLPTQAVEQLLVDPGLRAFTPTSITNPDRYLEVLATVRAQGYAIDADQAYLLDMGAISVPIFGPGGEAAGDGRGACRPEVVAVVTLVNFSSRLSTENLEQFTPWVVEAGRAISERLGVPLKELNGAGLSS
jgi:IclR family transcriptional regulator, KDG regulon repressor